MVEKIGVLSKGGAGYVVEGSLDVVVEIGYSYLVDVVLKASAVGGERL